MNKFEVNEIKKNFKSGSSFFTLNRIFVNIVNGDGEIKHTINKSGALLDQREENMYYNILRSTLSTKVGKNLIQYEFNKEAYEPLGAQSILNSVKESGFNADADNQAFVQNIISNYASEVPYAIVAAHCTYTVRRRDKLGIVKDVEDEEYKYILTAICPVVSVDSGFSYNNQTGEFSTECDPKLYIQQKPTDGFLYPAFDDRSPNVNSVMYYCKKSANPDISIISDVLDCPFVYSADQEKETFQYIITNAFGDKANYAFMYALNEEFCNLAEEHSRDTRLYEMQMGDFVSVLENIGVTDEEHKGFQTLYQQYVGENRLHLNNLVENVIRIKTSEFTIGFKQCNGRLLSTTVIDGARAIKLKTDDSQMELNGTEVSI